MKANKKGRSNMLIDERRQHVLAKIQSEGRVLVSELSEALGISRITIRKDLRSRLEQTEDPKIPSASLRAANRYRHPASGASSGTSAVGA